jgi:hypothetical protein
MGHLLERREDSDAEWRLKGSLDGSGAIRQKPGEDETVGPSSPHLSWK